VGELVAFSFGSLNNIRGYTRPAVAVEILAASSAAERQDQLLPTIPNKYRRKVNLYFLLGGDREP